MVDLKQIFVLNGLDCPNCAEKVRAGIEKLDFVKSAEMNFFSKKLTLDFIDSHDGSSAVEQVKSVVRKYEPDVVVMEHSLGNAYPDQHTLEPSHQHEHIHNDEGCSCSEGSACKRIQENPFEHEHNQTDDDNEKKENTIRIARMIASGVLLAVALALPDKYYTATTILSVIAYITVGYEIVWSAVKNIFKGQIFDESFLMTVASIGAFIIGSHEEAVGVMLFYNVGEFFNDIAVSKSRKSITKLMDLRPDYVNVMRNGQLVRVSPEEVPAGDTIIVKTGERIAIDGVISKGNSSLDTVAVTGESVPIDVSEGDSVISGCINLQGVLEIKTSTAFADSTVAKILEMTENAQSKKAKAENFITRFAKYYTPVVVIGAALLALIPSIITKEPSTWIYRALNFLVVSCPCALVISIPLSYFSGIGSASSKGVLVKGGVALDTLAECDTLVFDKTGTLTKGKLSVSNINPINNFPKEQLLEYAAHAEAYSTHPIAEGIRNAYGKNIDHNAVTCEEIAGKGIKARYQNHEILCGKAVLLSENNVAIHDEPQGASVLIAVDGTYAGSIELEDEVKDNVKDFIAKAKQSGIKKTVMLTGDKKTTAEKIAKAIGIDEVRAELLPEDKVTELEKIIESGHKAAYTGDGINDAPVLSRADIGIAMGGMGADAAIEAADIVIMNDEISKIAAAIRIAKKTKIIVRQNIVFSLAVKFAVLTLSVFGMVTMWWAVFADVGVSIIAILNSLRTKLVKN